MSRLCMVFTVFSLAVIVSGCQRNVPQNNVTTLPEVSDAPQISNELLVGEVVETMDAGGYTYAHLDTGVEKVWAAAPVCKVSVGDKLAISTEMPMPNWESKTLGRSFDLVYFVAAFQDPNGNAIGGGSPHGGGMMGGQASGGSGGTGAQRSAAPTNADVGEVEQLEGGQTIGEIHTAKAELAGKEVKFRGKVTKYTAQVMGKNWLHVQDGTGDSGARTHDMTVTTTATANVGDTVVITGKLELDKDFGFGYKYDLIIEDASVTVE